MLVAVYMRKLIISKTYLIIYALNNAENVNLKVTNMPKQLNEI